MKKGRSGEDDLNKLTHVDDEDCGGPARVLHVGEGIPVMLRASLDPEDGLVNGATGRVSKVISKKGIGVTGIDVLFDDPKVGRAKHRKFGRVKKAKAIRIGKVGVDYDGYLGSRIHRLQFPLVNAFASTVHKAQGKSCDAVSINLGKKGRQKCMAYVACSRCRKGCNVFLEEFDPSSIVPAKDVEAEMLRLQLKTMQHLKKLRDGDVEVTDRIATAWFRAHREQEKSAARASSIAQGVAAVVAATGVTAVSVASVASKRTGRDTVKKKSESAKKEKRSSKNRSSKKKKRETRITIVEKPTKGRAVKKEDRTRDSKEYILQPLRVLHAGVDAKIEAEMKELQPLPYRSNSCYIAATVHMLSVVKQFRSFIVAVFGSWHNMRDNRTLLFPQFGMDTQEDSHEMVTHLHGAWSEWDKSFEHDKWKKPPKVGLKTEVWLECTDCRAPSRRKVESEWSAMFHVPVPRDDNKQSVQGLVAKALEPELLTVGCLCSCCGLYSPHTRQTSVVAAGEYFGVQLLRFDWGGKINTHVRNSEEVQMSGGVVGSVRGIMHHSGKTDMSGHYTASIRFRGLEAWPFWYCDGDEFKLRSMKTALSDEAYMVLYKTV